MHMPLAAGQHRFVVLSGRQTKVELIKPALSERDAWLCWTLPDRLMIVVSESEIGRIAPSEPRD
jgi:hypothetical protein